MSARTGAFVRVKISDVSRDAAINGKAAFLAPPIGITPSSGTPPLMQILSIASVVRAAPPTPAAGSSLSIGGHAAVRLFLLYSEAALKPVARYRLLRLFWIPVRHAAAGPGPAPCAAADCRATPGPSAPRALGVPCRV